MSEILTKGQEAKNELEQIKYLLKVGELSYEGAILKAKTPLKQLNEEMERISNEHGYKHKTIGFTRFMR
jgi:hypothetical protein